MDVKKNKAHKVRKFAATPCNINTLRLRLQEVHLCIYCGDKSHSRANCVEGAAYGIIFRLNTSCQMALATTQCTFHIDLSRPLFRLSDWLTGAEGLSLFQVRLT